MNKEKIKQLINNWKEDQTPDELSKSYLVIAIWVILIIIIMTSCSPNYSSSLITGTVHKPTKREINRAMSYSSWEYAQPEAQIMISGSKSNFTFTNK
jgi:hypothetical protein